MPSKPSWGRRYCLAAGVCDTLTGALLIAAPLWTLRLMRIPSPPLETVYLRWVGAFVCGVGLLYLYPFTGRDPQRAASRWTTVLEVTALVRIVVALFVAVAVARGELAWQWSSVPLTDLALAAVQLLMLRRGVFSDA